MLQDGLVSLCASTKEQRASEHATTMVAVVCLLCYLKLERLLCFSLSETEQARDDRLWLRNSEEPICFGDHTVLPLKKKSRTCSEIMKTS